MRTPGYETALILSVRRKEENSLIIVMSPRMDNWTYATRVSKQVSRAMCYQHLDIDPRLLLVERPKQILVSRASLPVRYHTMQKGQGIPLRERGVGVAAYSLGPQKGGSCLGL